MFELNSFINRGIKDIARCAGRFYLGNAKGHAFILKMASSLKRATTIRGKYERRGTHIPPFLIASIATRCNLSCAGCYARANGCLELAYESRAGCLDPTDENNTDASKTAENRFADKTADKSAENRPKVKMQPKELMTQDWLRIFGEAADIGVSFILLAGGEPLLRRDIIKAACAHKSILFPIFTNGTLIDDEYLQLFDEHRNLIPVLSIEGDDALTDARRGAGVANVINKIADKFAQKGILFGVSVTVTSENIDKVSTPEFAKDLIAKGCGLVFYVEYVPAEAGTEHLVLSETELLILSKRVDELRTSKDNRGMIILSFPGDEDAMGGCLAAGRGFFHINANGAAEPCPFSPYSELNLRKYSLIQVLESDFFKKVRQISASGALVHKGGCTLFEFEDDVVRALA